MYENIGAKLKTIAQVIAIVSVTVGVIVGLWLYSFLVGELRVSAMLAFFAGVVAGALCFFVGWCSGLTLYVNGEIVHRLVSIDERVAVLQRKVFENKTPNQSTVQPAPVPKPVMKEKNDRWFCMHCGAENPKNTVRCHQCGGTEKQ